MTDTLEVEKKLDTIIILLRKIEEHLDYLERNYVAPS
jgi:hypothetical protein